MVQKSVSILFSGGLDSTYLVYSLLKDPNISSIKLIYVEIQNNVEKIKVEKIQLPKIISLLKKYDENNKIVDAENIKGENVYYTVHYTCYINCESNNLDFKQLPLWIQASLYAVTDEIYIGYVQNDDAISYLKDFKKIWKSYKSINSSLPKLKFPLYKTSKEYIIENLPIDLFEEVFSCEQPIINKKEKTFIDCGCCVPCKKNKYLDIFYDWKRNIDRKYSLDDIN